MFPKSKQSTVYSMQLGRCATVRCALPAAQSQGGWLMPVAAFIVVVMGLLAAGMGMVSSQTSIANTQEQISVQSFYAAEAGAQYGMSRVFYDAANPISRTSASTACSAINGSSLTFSVAGMQNCQTSLSCSVAVDSGNTTSFFSISSTANCGVAPVTAQRTVDVSAYLQ